MRWLLLGVVLQASGCDRRAPGSKSEGSAPSPESERAAWNKLRERGLDCLVIGLHQGDKIWRVECWSSWADEITKVEFDQLASRGRQASEREAAFHCKDATWSIVAVVDAGSKEEPAVVRWFWNDKGVRVSKSAPEKGLAESANAFLARLQKQAYFVR